MKDSSNANAKVSENNEENIEIEKDQILNLLMKKMKVIMGLRQRKKEHLM